MAGVVDHAAGDDLPVAACRLRYDKRSDNIGTTAVLSIFSVYKIGRCGDCADCRRSVAACGYRRRWTIETLFGNLKTKGFNLEDTHITNAEKLSTLLCVLSLSVALAVKTGAGMAAIKPIPIKKHGRKAWSLFAFGLHTFRKICVVADVDQVIAFLKQLLSPKLPLNSLKYMAL